MSTKVEGAKLSVAIEGDGISPSSINLRHLSELLAATMGAIEAVAREKGLQVPSISLTKVRKGSAAYDLSSSEPIFEPLVDRFYEAAKTRGANSDVTTRLALSRLFNSGKVGAVRMTARTSSDKKPRVLHLAAPLEVVKSVVLTTDTLHGRIVMIAENNQGRIYCRLALDDGGRTDVDLPPDMTSKVVSLFGKSVRVDVEGQWDGTEFSNWRLEEVTQCEGSGSFLDALHEIRDEIIKDGIQLDAQKWLSEQD